MTKETSAMGSAFEGDWQTLVKLGRPGQSNELKKDLLNSLYMITSEEQASSKLQQLNDKLNHNVSPQSKVVFQVISALFCEDLRVQFGRI
jgi:Trp operon repressor